jgi:hypothetical protein
MLRVRCVPAAMSDTLTTAFSSALGLPQDLDVRVLAHDPVVEMLARHGVTP